VFLDAIVDMKDDYVYMPKKITELNRVSSCYGVAGLPGCIGSIDVVHVKWANCPAGNFNRAKGKETFPSLGFECITDFNHRVLSIYGPHFGSRNDMDIVKTDEYVHEVRSKRLFRDAQWSYYNHNGHVRQANGMYLICDRIHALAHDYLSLHPEEQFVTRGVFLDKHRERSQGRGVHFRDH
jgi:hypothetical protein